MIEPSARILTIESSGRWGSAALGTPEGVIATGELAGPMQHAADFLALTAQLLQDQQWPASTLTHVFVSAGPGSFTGLRIGVSMARTLAWSLEVKIVAVPTLDAVARNLAEMEQRPAHVAVMLDAKRGQVYAAGYELTDGIPTRLMGPVLEDPVSFLQHTPSGACVMGEGIPYHRPVLDAADVEILPENTWRPQARSVFATGLEMARSGLYTPGEELIPIYVRRPEAEEKWEKLHPPKG